MNKKIFVFLFAAIFLSTASFADAQQPKKVRRIGYLSTRSASQVQATTHALRRGLSDLGYVEGQNIMIEYSWADDTADRLPHLAAQLVRLGVEVIVAAGGTPAILAAKNATSSIPIIFAGLGTDPVELGLVASLARPGGNITGVSSGGSELYGKRLELLKDTVPRLSRVAYLRNPDNPASRLTGEEIIMAARALGLQIQTLEVRKVTDLDAAFETAKRSRADGLIVSRTPPISSDPNRVVSLATKSRLPAIYADRDQPEAGGLMSYSTDPADLYHRAAVYVDKILKGSKAADLPVEQPKKFEFVINLKAAKQIGLTIPPNVLARADKVIR